MKFAGMLWLSALCAAPVWGQAVSITVTDGNAEVSVDHKPFTTFHANGVPKPFLHPVRSASGKVVTRRYPMEKVEGETTDHPHHRGIWFTHGDVNGWDFWMNEPTSRSVGKGAGKIRMRRMTVRPDLNLFASFEWSGGDNSELLTENRTMTFAGHQDRLRWIDFDIELAAKQKVVFGDTKEGTFAIRLRDELMEKKGGRMRSSTGAEGMKNVWGKPFPWVDYTGTLEGEELGIAIFDHPENPRAPTRWHARDYGLFAANIFGLHDFLNDKSQDGSFTIDAGKSARFRYRVLIHSKDTNVAVEYERYATGR
ncbi:MAG: PmoA family protein [Bryobacteraceae bacterium]|nr:PmoA family protein [Bryobacteraceae bacterium]